MHGPLNVKISICIFNIHINVSILFTPTLRDLFTWSFSINIVSVSCSIDASYSSYAFRTVFIACPNSSYKHLIKVCQLLFPRNKSAEARIQPIYVI